MVYYGIYDGLWNSSETSLGKINVLKTTCEDGAKTKDKKQKVKQSKKRTETIAQSRRDLKLRGKWRPGEELLKSGMRILGNRVILLSIRYH